MERVSRLANRILSYSQRVRAQGMVEYALIITLISVVVIILLLTTGNQIKNVFSNIVVYDMGA